MTSPLHHRRVVVLAFFLAAFAALFTLPMVAAHAGPPPSLTATPNPVLIPTGQTAGTFTLAWTLGGQPTVDLWFSVNNGPQFGPFAEVANGTNQVAINAGDTHVWKMFAKGDTKTPLAAVTVTGRHPNTSCASPCIKLATAERHGTWAHFHVITTSIVKKLDLEIHEPGQAPTTTKSIVPSSNDWQPDPSGLKPNQDYGWTVTATDEAGNQQKATGVFRTLRRQVKVAYNPIQVIDDSDDLSAGDLTFWFGFKGKMDTTSFGEVGVDSGHATFPNHTSTFDNAPDVVGLVVVGQDNDCDFFDFCSLPFETPATGPVGHGSDSLSDWATASTSVNVAVDGPGETFTTVKNVSTTQWELQFAVKATVSVTYV